MKKKNSGFFYQSTNGKFLIGFLLFSNPLRDVIGEGDKLRGEFCFRGVEQVSKKGFKRGQVGKGSISSSIKTRGRVCYF